MLEIVEDKEEMPLADVIPDELGEWRCRGLTDAEGLRYGGEHKCWILQWNQPHERNAVTESGFYGTSCRDSEPGLADSAGADQGDEGDIGIAKKTAKIGQLSLSPDQRSAGSEQRGELTSSRSRGHGVYLAV